MAEEIQRVRFIYDAKDSLEAFALVEKAIKNQGNAVNDLVAVMKAIDPSGRANILTLKAINQAGNAAAVTVQKLADSWEVSSG
jgi:hypothetical protein